MLFGTLAGILVAVGTVPIGIMLTGMAASPRIFFASATAFAIAGGAIMIIVGYFYRDAVAETGFKPIPARHGERTKRLALNRSFVILMGAMMSMIIGTTFVGKSVLHYFKYQFHDVEAGQLALASMMIVSAVSVPVWMAIARFAGSRSIWFLATLVGVTSLASFAAFDMTGMVMTQIFLISMQAATAGFHF